MEKNVARVNLEKWVPGSPLSAAHLQQTNEAIAQLQTGIDPSVQSGVEGYPSVIKCRLVVTTTRALSGLGTIDGETVAENDLILFATGGSPESNGVYEASVGAWRIVWRLSSTQDANAFILPRATMIVVSDGSSGPFAWRVTADETFQSLNSSGGSQQFKIVSIGADHLVCHAYDGTTEGAVIFFIAKPWLLRRSLTAWNGMTFTYSSDQARTATLGASTESQVVVPAYVAGDVIYALGNVIGGNSVVTASPVNWVDVNADGRAWAKV